MMMPMETFQKQQNKFMNLQIQHRQQIMQQQSPRDPRIRNMKNPAVPAVAATAINPPGFVNYMQFNSTKRRHDHYNYNTDSPILKKNKIEQVNSCSDNQGGKSSLKWQQPLFSQPPPGYPHHQQQQQQPLQQFNKNYYTPVFTTRNKIYSPPANSAPGAINKFNGSHQQFNKNYHNPVFMTRNTLTYPPPNSPGAMNKFNGSHQQVYTNNNNNQLLATRNTMPYPPPNLPGAINKFNGSHQQFNNSNNNQSIATRITTSLPSPSPPGATSSGSSSPSSVGSSSPKLDINALYQNLLESGLVQQLSDNNKLNIEVKKEPEIIEVSFDEPKTLKIKRPDLVAALYTGTPCGNCGLRFTSNSIETYDQHLDWHFRQARKEKAAAKTVNSRSWYYNINDWMRSDEIEAEEDRKASFFETQKEEDKVEQVEEIIIISAPFKNEKCPGCYEKFEDIWMNDEDEWHSLEAVAFEGKNYHQVCLDDHKKRIEEEEEEEEEDEVESDEIIKSEPKEGI